MSGVQFKVVQLNATHDKTTFNSDSEPLNRYFKEQASQDIKRRVSACFVAITQDNEIVGYYTLASASVLLSELPELLLKKLPRYPTVPAVRLGRLAVSTQQKSQGIGAALLADALLRSASNEIAAYALIVDAKDAKATAFYQHHGFMALGVEPMKLFLPLANIKFDY